MQRIKAFFSNKEKRNRLLGALLLGLLPLALAQIYCVFMGQSIGKVYLPASEWNDELFYFKQVESIIKFGYPQGYFGFNESHAAFLSFAAWSPVLVFPWVLWGLAFGWTLSSPIWCNIFLLCLAFFLFGLLARPSKKQQGIIMFLCCLFFPFIRYMLSCMPEIICFAHMLVFYAVAVAYEKKYHEQQSKYGDANAKKKVEAKLVWLFVLAALGALMRPYLMLLFLLPAYYLIRKRRVVGAVITAGSMGVTFLVYYLINHFLGAAYFAPLFFTDWITAFFERGLWGGIKYFLYKLFIMGREFARYTIQGFIDGFPTGIFYGCFAATLCVLLVYVVTLWKDAAGQKAKATKPELLPVYVHLTISFIGMLLAMLLMYKLNEGARHLMMFVAAGIFLIGMMRTKTFKKAAFAGAVFAYLFSFRGGHPLEFAVPFYTQELGEQVLACEEAFAEKLVLDNTQNPSYENVVMWVFGDYIDRDVDNELVSTPWQMLYKLPAGFGISCCYDDYIRENFEELQSRYLAVVAGGTIDAMCGQAGWTVLYRTSDFVLYERPDVYAGLAQTLSQGDYWGVFASEFDISGYAAEDFLTYRGLSVFVEQNEITGRAALKGFLECALRNSNDLQVVYLGLDPGGFYSHLGTQAADRKRALDEELGYFCRQYPQVQFELLLAAPSLADWQALDDAKERLARYKETIRSLEPYENCNIFFLGAEEWLIANPANYRTDWGEEKMNAGVCKNMLLHAFCDHAYLICENTMETVFDSLWRLINGEGAASAYDLQEVAYGAFDASGERLIDKQVIFFGDSVMGNYSGSLSIPGVVNAFSGARVENRGVGGACAAALPDEENSFIRQVQEYLGAEIARARIANHNQMVFVIGFGLNDYFRGVPIENREERFDTVTYTGALRTGIEGLKKQYPEAEFLLLTPTYTDYFDSGTGVQSENGGVLTEYVEAVKKVAKEYDLPCLDQYQDAIIAKETASYLLADGCHPNEQGRYLIGLAITKRLL